MKYCYLLTIVSTIGMLLIGVDGSRAQMTVAQPMQTKAEVETGIRFFEGSWNEALAESRKTGKPIFMDCYTVWCVPCKRLAQEVFTKPEVGEYFNSRFINVKMDMGTDQGKELNKRYKVTGYPTLLFLDKDGNMSHRIVGAPDGKILLREAVRAIEGNGYTSMNRMYTEGNRQPGFIQNYMEVLDVAGEGKKAADICLEYFDTLDKTKLKEREYWDLFIKYVKDVDSDEAKYVYKNRKEFINLYGEKEVNRKLFQLYNGGAYRYWKEEDGIGVFDEKGFEKYVRDLLKRDIDRKEQIISDARMNYAMKAGNWAEFVRLGSERLQAGENSEFIVYNWGLRVNMACKDMVLREEVAKWMEQFAMACDRKPNAKESASLKNSFLTVTDKLRHPEKNDKNYRPTITITGKVAALREGEDIIRLIKKEGFFKQVIDSCDIKSDGTYELKMRVENPGVYILECQGGQRVEFWAGKEDVRVDFPGFGNAKVKVMRSMYIRVTGGDNNEVMDKLNWEAFRNMQFMGNLSRPVYGQKEIADPVKQELSLQLSEVAIHDMCDRLQHWAEMYADREAVVAILAKLRGEEYAETVQKVLTTLEAKYPTSVAVKDFKAARAQQELIKQGGMAPEFSCPTPDGKKNLGPQDFKGKYLVMDFWASWCGPCRGEIPHLKEAYAKYADKGVAFFSVSIDKSDAAWKKALAEENMPWEQVCAPQAGKDVMKQYQFSGIPYILVLDKEGRIVGTNLRGKALMDKLEELVNESKPKTSMMMR
ncbi:TlpA family protein disulfide reductase [Butyricimonas sp. Marseille-P3923]|uniref:TlpA family protein disulfide reductase n=1 Tax=Butyricimonas sp. Marseille-P3923 TaxID=1987504 RepID=UPI000C0882A0|nr:TlpA family protein disulfide reductase [Butyricimonas sp. Marseille-P3923]